MTNNYLKKNHEKINICTQKEIRSRNIHKRKEFKTKHTDQNRRDYFNINKIKSTKNINLNAMKSASPIWQKQKKQAKQKKLRKVLTD